MAPRFGADSETRRLSETICIPKYIWFNIVYSPWILGLSVRLKVFFPIFLKYRYNCHKCNEKKTYFLGNGWFSRKMPLTFLSQKGMNIFFGLSFLAPPFGTNFLIFYSKCCLSDCISGTTSLNFRFPARREILHLTESRVRSGWDTRTD